MSLGVPAQRADGAPLMCEQKNYLASSSLPKNARKRQLPCLLIGGIVVAVLLGLALGLGLGLGLKHSSKTSAPPPSVVANSSSATPPNSYASPNLTSLRLATRDYSLDMADWDIAAPPTTRVYNFTLGEIDAAPDGQSCQSSPPVLVANDPRCASENAGY